jgi:hypothetical protein
MTRAGEKLTLTVPTINPPSNPSFPPGYELIDFHQVETFVIEKTYINVSVIAQNVPQNPNDEYLIYTIVPITDDGAIDYTKEPIQVIEQSNCKTNITINFKVDSSYFVNDTRKFMVIANTYEKNRKGTTPNVNLYADINSGIFMAGSLLNSSTDNPWMSESSIITVSRTGTNIQNIYFRTFNITLEHNNFTEPSPILRWTDNFTNATKYLVMVMVEVDASTNRDNFDNDPSWDLIFYKKTSEKELRLGIGLFYDYEDEEFITEYGIPEQLVFRQGETLRIEIYALNNDNNSVDDVDFSEYKGAYYMEALNVVRE